MITLELLTKDPMYQVKSLACTTIGKTAKRVNYSQEEQLDFWRSTFKQEHSILRVVSFKVFDNNMRSDICAQLLRATKGHPQPEVQSHRPDWNSGEPRKPSSETYGMFAHIHTAESWMALCRQRLCKATMKETKQKVEEILSVMKNSPEPFFKALYEYSVPQCVYRLGCCDRTECGFMKIFKSKCVEKNIDVFSIMDRYKFYKS